MQYQTLTSKCVSPHEHEIVTISGQGAQAPLQENKKYKQKKKNLSQ